MGRVARLILLVVVSVYNVFCVLWCLQNNPVVSNVTVVLLCQFLVLAIKTGKKSSSCLSGALCCCVSFWFWREIGSFFVVVGMFYYDRKKKF